MAFTSPRRSGMCGRSRRHNRPYYPGRRFHPLRHRKHPRHPRGRLRSRGRPENRRMRPAQGNGRLLPASSTACAFSTLKPNPPGSKRSAPPTNTLLGGQARRLPPRRRPPTARLLPRPTGEKTTLVSTRSEIIRKALSCTISRLKGAHTYFVLKAAEDGLTGAGVLVHNATRRNCGRARPPKESPTELARRLGREGELAAGIDPIKKKRIPSLSGRRKYRIPDEMTRKTLTEVKNVKYQHFSTQLRDSLHFSIMTNRQMILKVRRDTILSADRWRRSCRLDQTGVSSHER